MKKIALVCFISAILVIAACNRDQNTQKISREDRRIVPVEVVKVKKGDIISYLSATGTVFPVQEAHVGPRISGRIEKLFADEGDYVEKGQTLIMLEQKSLEIANQQADAALEIAQASLQKLLAGTRDEEIKRAEAVFAKAEANLRNSELEFSRLKKLYEKHTVAKNAYDAAYTQYKVASAAYDEAKEILRMARQGPTSEDIEIARAQVKQAQVNVRMTKQRLEDTLTKAPFAGFVVKKLKNEGECVTATPVTSILKIEDISKIKVEVKMPENEMGKIQKGDPAEVSVDAFPDRTFTGSVVVVNPAVDPASRTFKAKVEIPNNQGLLKSGMFARVLIAVEHHKGIHIVSRDALMETNDNWFVFVINDETAHKKRITTGISQNDLIEVKEGLNEGDIVVIAGQYDLKEGSRVKIVKGETGTIAR